jgi:hypothetical protein
LLIPFSFFYEWSCPNSAVRQVVQIVPGSTVALRAQVLAGSAVHHTGTRRPCFDNLRGLAEALNVTADYLLGRTDDPEGLADTVDHPLFRDVANLQETDRETVRAMIDHLARKARERRDG